MLDLSAELVVELGVEREPLPAHLAVERELLPFLYHTAQSQDVVLAACISPPHNFVLFRELASPHSRYALVDYTGESQDKALAVPGVLPHRSVDSREAVHHVVLVVHDEFRAELCLSPDRVAESQDMVWSAFV